MFSRGWALAESLANRQVPLAGVLRVPARGPHSALWGRASPRRSQIGRQRPRDSSTDRGTEMETQPADAVLISWSPRGGAEPGRALASWLREQEPEWDEHPGWWGPRGPDLEGRWRPTTGLFWQRRGPGPLPGPLLPWSWLALETAPWLCSGDTAVFPSAAWHLSRAGRLVWR